MADEPRKRSRFDQGPPTAAPQSRSDRRSRSRSPSRRDAEPTRTRSPPPADGDSAGGSKKREDAMVAAAEAAARINASIKSNRGPHTVYVPPIRSSNTPDESSNTPATATPETEGKSYMQNGDFKQDIEIHDYRTRFLVTNAAAQKKIRDDFGVDVTTKGAYYPDKSLATAAKPPLHLHVTATTKEALEKAVAHIHEILAGNMPELIDQRRFRPRQQEEQQRSEIERDRLGRPKWPEEKIPVDLEPIPDFNLRAQVVGQGGQYVKYIVEQSGARVQVKGHGSHWKERDTGEEIDEPMFLHITDRDPERVAHAAQLCRELLENVRKNYDDFKESRNQRPHHGGGGRGGRGGGYAHNGRQGSYPSVADQYGYGRQQSHDENGTHYGYAGGHAGYPGQQSYEGPGQFPTQAPGQNAYQIPGQYPGQATAQAPGQAAGSHQAQMSEAGQQQQEGSVQEWINYYTANPELDPYAQYGGYAAMMQHYQQRQQQQQQQGVAFQQQDTATPNPPGAASMASPPPPPPPPGTDGSPPGLRGP